MAPDRRVPLRPRSALLVGLALLLVLAGLAGLAGCSSGSSSTASEAPPVTDPTTPVVYAAIGGLETLNSDRDDLPDNWPQLLFRDHMAPGGVYVNLASPDATVKSALDGQLSQALDLHATVATIWLESADERLGTSVRVYHDELTTLVEDLQAGGVKVYLLRSGPNPGDPTPLQASVTIVSGETGAPIVDLGDISDRSDDSGQRRIAEQVAATVGPDLGG
ncbi:MAG: hypothetical protein ACXWA3_08720 [Acidimicrobiales bacterium]